MATASEFEAIIFSLPNSEAIPLKGAKDVVAFFTRAINLLHPEGPWQPSAHSEMPNGFYEKASEMGLLANQGNLVLITEFGRKIAQHVKDIFNTSN